MKLDYTLHMNKLIHFILQYKKIVLVIFGVISIAAFFFWPKNIAVIETEKVKEESITESIPTTGNIESETSVSLNFLGGGKVVYLGAKEGDEVTQYQTIAVLDQRTV
jgi:multidrug efflux pump subunit AcrA (membrane-fusion protein)